MLVFFQLTLPVMMVLILLLCLTVLISAMKILVLFRLNPTYHDFLESPCCFIHSDSQVLWYPHSSPCHILSHYGWRVIVVIFIFFICRQLRFCEIVVPPDSLMDLTCNLHSMAASFSDSVKDIYLPWVALNLVEGASIMLNLCNLN